MSKGARKAAKAVAGRISCALAEIDVFGRILAAHERDRSICDRMHQIAYAGRITRREARILADYFRTEWFNHHKRENESLFPLLKRRALPEDGIDDVLGRLEQEHVKAKVLVEGFLPVLENQGPDNSWEIPSHLAAAIIRFTSIESRHVAVENSIVLAIARVRLTKGDVAFINDNLMRQ